MERCAKYCIDFCNLLHLGVQFLGCKYAYVQPYLIFAETLQKCLYYLLQKKQVKSMDSEAL